MKPDSAPTLPHKRLTRRPRPCTIYSKKLIKTLNPIPLLLIGDHKIIQVCIPLFLVLDALQLFRSVHIVGIGLQLLLEVGFQLVQMGEP